MSAEILEWWEDQLAGQEYPSDYGGDDFWSDDGWILTVSWNPMQTKLEEIAFEILTEELMQADEDNFDLVRFRHWACGYVMQVNIRPIVDGKVTSAGDIVYHYMLDDGYDYLERASESDAHYEWEREMIVDGIGYHIKCNSSISHDLTDEQLQDIATHLVHECDVCVESDGSLWVSGAEDLATVIEEATKLVINE